MTRRVLVESIEEEHKTVQYHFVVSSIAGGLSLLLFHHLARLANHLIHRALRPLSSIKKPGSRRRHLVEWGGIPVVTLDTLFDAFSARFSPLSEYRYSVWKCADTLEIVIHIVCFQADSAALKLDDDAVFLAVARNALDFVTFTLISRSPFVFLNIINNE